MKLKLLTIITLCFYISLQAQDNIKVESDTSTFTPPQYQTVYDDVFLNQQEIKSLWKLDFINPLLGENESVTLEYERKLTPRFSINTSITSLQYTLFFRGYGVSVEPRFYLKSKKGLGNIQKANNLNGNYLGLQAFTSVRRDHHGDEVKLDIIANYGIQRRILNYWYVNYQLGAGVRAVSTNPWNNDYKDKVLFLHSKFTIGLALGGKKVQTNTCDLFNCFEEESRLIKLDLRRVLDFRFGGVYSRAGFGYEQKLGQSAWSLNNTLTLGGYSILNSKYKFINLGIEPRYYINLKKRIAKGKSANNLSGSYVSVELNAQTSDDYSQVEAFKVVGVDTIRYSGFKRFNTTLSIKPKIGIQKRLFKNGFLDIALAPFDFRKDYASRQLKMNNGTWTDKIRSNYNGFNFNETDWSSYIDFKLGLAF